MSATNLLSALKNDTDLSLLVANRISLAPAVHTNTYPFVTFEFVSDEPIRTLKGNSCLNRQDYQITITGDKYSSIEEVKKVILSLMDSHKSTFSAIWKSGDYDFDAESNTHKHYLLFTLIY